MSKSGVCLWMWSTASWMTVRFFSPRKSIFRRPISVMAFMSAWVTTSPSLARASGTWASRFPSPITTPAAWTPVFLMRPSSLEANAQSSENVDDASTMSRSSGLASHSDLRVTPGTGSMSLARVSASPYETPMTRATSRMTDLAPSVP